MDELRKLGVVEKHKGLVYSNVIKGFDAENIINQLRQ